MLIFRLLAKVHFKTTIGQKHLKCIIFRNEHVFHVTQHNIYKH